MKARREKIGPRLYRGPINRTVVGGCLKDLASSEPEVMWREPLLNPEMQHETNAPEYH